MVTAAATEEASASGPAVALSRVENYLATTSEAVIGLSARLSDLQLAS